MHILRKVVAARRLYSENISYDNRGLIYYYYYWWWCSREVYFSIICIMVDETWIIVVFAAAAVRIVGRADQSHH